MMMMNLLHKKLKEENERNFCNNKDSKINKQNNVGKYVNNRKNS